MIDYLQNEEIKILINDAPSYQKSALTGLRKIKFTTYVKSGNGVRIESEPFLPGVVIARNPGVIGYDNNGNEIYNEWPITVEVASKNYGSTIVENLTEEISYHKKQAIIKAIELTPYIMEILGVKGDTLDIKVSWILEPMKAKLGDFLTDGGYSISAHDMQSTYEPVMTADNNKSCFRKKL